MSWFFRTKTVRNIPTGTPNGGVECKGYEKNSKITMANQYKVVRGLSNGAIFNDLKIPNPAFKVTPFFNAAYLRNGTRCRHSYSEKLIGMHTLFSRVSFRMTLSDLE